MSEQKNPQVEMYVKAISEKVAKEGGLTEAKDGGLHMSSASHGEGHIHITDMPHNEKSIEHIEKGIGERLHKAHPKIYKSAQHATDSYQYAHGEQENGGFGHHALASSKNEKKKPLATMSSSEYMDSEAKNSHKFIVQNKFHKEEVAPQINLYAQAIAEQAARERGELVESADVKAAKAFASHQKLSTKGYDDLKMKGVNGYFHKHNDGPDQTYIIKHDSGKHSMTTVDHLKQKSEKDWEAQSREDNPHLSDSEHKEVAKAISKNS